MPFFNQQVQLAQKNKSNNSNMKKHRDFELEKPSAPIKRPLDPVDEYVTVLKDKNELSDEEVWEPGKKAKDLSTAFLDRNKNKEKEGGKTHNQKVRTCNFVEILQFYVIL